jgi:hypothetical protein
MNKGMLIIVISKLSRKKEGGGNKTNLKFLYRLPSNKNTK